MYVLYHAINVQQGTRSYSLLFKIVLIHMEVRGLQVFGVTLSQYGGKANNESGMFGETNFTLD